MKYTHFIHACISIYWWFPMIQILGKLYSLNTCRRFPIKVCDQLFHVIFFWTGMYWLKRKEITWKELKLRKGAQILTTVFLILHETKISIKRVLNVCDTITLCVEYTDTELRTWTWIQLKRPFQLTPSVLNYSIMKKVYVLFRI